MPRFLLSSTPCGFLCSPNVCYIQMWIYLYLSNYSLTIFLKYDNSDESDVCHKLGKFSNFDFPFHCYCLCSLIVAIQVVSFQSLFIKPSYFYPPSYFRFCLSMLQCQQFSHIIHSLSQFLLQMILISFKHSQWHFYFINFFIPQKLCFLLPLNQILLSQYLQFLQIILYILNCASHLHNNIALASARCLHLKTIFVITVIISWFRICQYAHSDFSQQNFFLPP